MKSIIGLVIIFIFSTHNSNAQEEAKALPVLSKTPRSLFLVKKAKIDNDVSEPVLYPSEKQSKLLTDEKIYNKYRLQILDPQKNNWGNTQ